MTPVSHNETLPVFKVTPEIFSGGQKKTCEWVGQDVDPLLCTLASIQVGPRHKQQQQRQRLFVLNHLALVLSRLCTTPTASRVFTWSPPLTNELL